MTNPFILPLADCEGRRLVGGKAVGLGRLIRHGFRVPPGVCVTTMAYHESLEQAGLPSARMWKDARAVAPGERQSRLKEWIQRIRALTLPEALLDELHRALGEAPETGASPLWAVRSSATHEDDDDATGAGLYTTRLGVPRD